MPRVAVRVTMRENARGKRRFSRSHIFFLLTGAFYSTLSEATEARKGGEVLGFIPVVNNIFIVASSEEKCGVRSAIPGDVCRSRARRRRDTIELLRGIIRLSPRS